MIWSYFYKIFLVVLSVTINDIVIILLLFADDMAIIGNSPDDLQHRLDLLKTYCDLWALQVNTGKTKIVLLRKHEASMENENWR